MSFDGGLLKASIAGLPKKEQDAAIAAYLADPRTCDCHKPGGFECGHTIGQDTSPGGNPESRLQEEA